MVGIGITGAGFVYDVMFAGVPFQDAPKQLQDQYTFHSNIASNMEVGGLLTAAGGILFAAIAFVRRSYGSRSPMRD
jgi:hypothetical protein